MKKSMSNEIESLGAKRYFSIILLIILITDLVILLNIPFLRQITGFLFLTLLPGLLILHILKLNKLGFVEKCILSWGVSVSFLMFFGLLINSSLFNLDYKTPLATFPLLISFNIAFIVLAAIGYKVNKGPFFSLPNLNLNTAEKAFLVIPILFPALSIFGMNVMNTTDNNIILMFLLFLIPIYVIFVCFFNHKFPKRIYPVVIFLISISLLLLLALRSDHLLGDDVHAEYHFFRTTLDNLHWSIAGHSNLDACLAISLLPAIYQSILNISPVFLYKILPSVLCSVFPVIIYVISKKYVGEFYGFLASMYFMSNNTFLWTEYNARAVIAMLFFAFAVMTLFNDRIEPLKKRMLFIVFMASCMVSHYSSTYAFFFVMLATFVGLEILSKKYSFKKVISVTIVVLFFAMIFFWYSQVTETAFNSGVNFVEQTFNSLFNFAVIEAKSKPAQMLLGEGIMQKSIVYKIHWVLTWITFAFIGIGVATLIRKYKEMSFPELKFKKPDFLKGKFEVVYFVLVLACSGLLVTILAIPHISKGYGLGRAYPIASTILAVFFVIGGIMLWKYLNKIIAALHGKASLNNKKSVIKKLFLKKETFAKETKKGKNGSEVLAYLIILLVLIPYFLCVTGAMYNIFGVPHSIILNPDYNGNWGIRHVQEDYSGRWLKNNTDQRNEAYADARMHRVLLTHSIDSIRAKDIKSIKCGINSYICLGYYNIIKKIEQYDMTEYSDVFIEKNRIYDNGGSEVWR